MNTTAPHFSFASFRLLDGGDTKSTVAMPFDILRHPRDGYVWLTEKWARSQISIDRSLEAHIDGSPTSRELCYPRASSISDGVATLDPPVSIFGRLSRVWAEYSFHASGRTAARQCPVAWLLVSGPKRSFRLLSGSDLEGRLRTTRHATSTFHHSSSLSSRAVLPGLEDTMI